MVFVEMVLTVSDCIMTVRIGIVWNGLDGFILQHVGAFFRDGLRRSQTVSDYIRFFDFFWVV